MLADPRPVADLGCWAAVCGSYSAVLGYTAFGNFFLVDPSSERFAVLYTIGPELAPTNFRGRTAFEGTFLTDPGIIKYLGRPNDFSAIQARLGPLGEDEVYIPEPYPFLGGSGEPDTFAKGNVWVFADLVGQMQDVGTADDPGA